MNRNQTNSQTTAVTSKTQTAASQFYTKQLS